MAVHSQDTNDGRRFIRRVAKLIAMSLAIVSMTSCMGSSADNSPTSGNTPSRVYAGTFSPTGSMETARSSPTATALPDGRVLIAGGASGQAESSVALASAELYDPATGTFSPTGSLATARGLHTATLLPDGRVLIAGGNDGSEVLASAELYDPATGKFSPTGPLATARDSHTATALSDGRVLIAAGYDGTRTRFASAELYDPTTGKFSPTGSLATARNGHTATLLSGGRVLITGGYDGSGYSVSAELYDPATGTFGPTGSMTDARTYHTATLLSDGRVLIAGGGTYDGDRWTMLAAAELYS